MSFPEDTASDADQGASLFDGEGIVVGHAHGYLLELRNILEMSFLHLVEEPG